MTKILVAYASKHHSTAEIAESIGQTLQKFSGLEVDIRPVGSVDDIRPYDAVILGSAVYVGQWQAEAGEFLERNETELAQRPVWLFSSGPTGEGDPEAILKGWEFPEALQVFIERIKPQDVTVFHGRLDADELNFIERAAARMVRAPMGDFRDWNLIQSWAASIAQAL